MSGTSTCNQKLLCAGQRSKGDTIADLTGVLAAVNRAIDLVEDLPDAQSENSQAAI